MSRCVEWYDKFEREGDFCHLSPAGISHVKAYNEFRAKIAVHIPDKEFVVTHFSEGASRAITKYAKDDATRTKAINYVISCLKNNETVTNGDLEQTIKGWLKPDGKCTLKKGSTDGNVGNVSENFTNVKSATPDNEVKQKDPVECKTAAERFAGTEEKIDPPKPKPAPCLSGGKCPDGFNHIVQDKVQGAMCFLWKHSLKQLPGDECYLDAKKRQSSTKPGFLDQGNTAFSRAGEIPKVETKWGSGKVISREEKMHILCTQILIPKQVQALTAIVKTGEADDELMALDVIIQEAAERMEGK